MTTDGTVQLLSDLMAVREHLSQLQATISDLTRRLAEDKCAPLPTKYLQHAAEPMPNAALHDEPPSRPL